MKKNRSFGLPVVILIIVLLFVCVVSVVCVLILLISAGGEKKITSEDGITYQTEINPIDLVDLAIDLENTHKLEDVRISEVAGGIVEIRTNTPESVSPEAMVGATAYIFGYVDARLPDQAKTVRLIFTVNGFDASLVEVSRENMKKWTTKDISDEQFVKTFIHRNLV